MDTNTTESDEVVIQEYSRCINLYGKKFVNKLRKLVLDINQPSDIRALALEALATTKATAVKISCNRSSDIV